MTGYTKVPGIRNLYMRGTRYVLREKKDGRDVWTTLEANTQKEAEREMIDLPRKRGEWLAESDRTAMWKQALHRTAGQAKEWAGYPNLERATKLVNRRAREWTDLPRAANARERRLRDEVLVTIYAHLHELDFYQASLRGIHEEICGCDQPGDSSTCIAGPASRAAFFYLLGQGREEITDILTDSEPGKYDLILQALLKSDKPLDRLELSVFTGMDEDVFEAELRSMETFQKLIKSTKAGRYSLTAKGKKMATGSKLDDRPFEYTGDEN